MVHERPRPPGKRPSTTRQSLGAFVPAPARSASSDDEEQSEATAELARPPGPALRNKLSSSSLSMAQPPDSPPDIYDQAVHDLASPSRRTRRVDEDQVSPLTSRSTNRGRESTGSISSTSSHVPGTIPFPTSSALVSSEDQRARTPYLHSKAASLNLDNFKRVMGVADEVKGASGPPLAREVIQEKSREELELMLQQADRLIREKTHALSELQSSGIRLVRDHQALRQRHDSLLSHSATSSSAGITSPLRHSRLSSASSLSAELRERPPPSPARQPWRSSLGLAAQPSSPPQSRRDPSDEYENEPQHRGVTTSPTTPLRQGHKHRVSSASSSSVASLFAPSPRIGLGSPSPQELQSLSQANYALSVQLSELEADSEQAEKEAKRKLRKLEKEIQGLRQELERVEDRNVALEDEVNLGASVSGGSGLMRKPLEVVVDDSTPKTKPSFTHQRRSSSSCSEDNSDSSPVQDFAPPNQLPAALNPLSPGTPTNAAAARLRRTPGNGTPRALVDSPTVIAPLTTHESNTDADVDPFPPPSSPSSTEDPSPSLTPPHDQHAQIQDQRQEDLVRQLMATIADLEATNEGIEEERQEMLERLELATKEVDVFKRKCEELEDGVVEGDALGWEDRKGIEWRSPSASPTSSRRTKGNRREIERAQRRSRSAREDSLPLSVSDTSIITTSSGCSISLNMSHRRMSGGYGRGARTLGSELGDHWDEDDEGSERSWEEDRDEYSEGDDGVRDDMYGAENASRATESTSTPWRRRTSSSFTHSPSCDFDTTSDLFPPGSLRHSAPEPEAYEQLTRMASELPAVWEDEEEFKLGVAAGSPMKSLSRGDGGKGARRRSRGGVHSGEIGGGVLRQLQWESGKGSDADQVDYWGRYPEEEEDMEMEQRMIEDGQMMELREKEDRRKIRKRKSRRKLGKGKEKAKEEEVYHCDQDLGLQIDSTDIEREGTPLSRRQLALRRLGLEDSPTSSSATLHADPHHLAYSCSSHSSDNDSLQSDYSNLSNTLVRRGRKYRHRNNFYPLTLRARYAPKMVLSRVTEGAVGHLFTLVTYLRFFVVLGMALAWALWQGPAKTLGAARSRRRLN